MSAPSSVPVPATARATRLLVVEDNDLLRDELVALLEAPHREIVEADSAEAALAHCVGGATFDVVVTDVGLPGASGLDLARELLARRADQPLILCSGHRLDAAASLGASGHVRVLFKDRIEQTLPEAVGELEALASRPLARR